MELLRVFKKLVLKQLGKIFSLELIFCILSMLWLEFENIMPKTYHNYVKKNLCPVQNM